MCMNCSLSPFVRLLHCSFMRNLALIMGILFGASSWLSAQVAVDLIFEQDQFLRDESIDVRVRIANRSGQKVEWGQEEDGLTFVFENRDGPIVRKLGEVPAGKPFSLESV